VTKDRSVYIRHIYDCICWIKEYVEAGKEAFFQDRKTQDAVIRNLEVIGEAVKALGNETRARSPQIAWSDVAGLRVGPEDEVENTDQRPADAGPRLVERSEQSSGDPLPYFRHDADPVP